jgi:CheY-like chemotaxis protein
MAEIILIVEDIPEEQEKAKAAVKVNGFKAAVAGNLEDAMRIWDNLGDKVEGVVTDLHFPEKNFETFGHGHGKAELTDALKPSGLAIVVEAARDGTPVAICSNINHHYCYYLRMVVGFLSEKHPLGKIPFIMDSKDWERAIQKLKEVISEKEVKQ